MIARLACAIVALMMAAVWVAPALAANASVDRPRHNAYGVFSVPNDRRSLDELETLGVGWVRQQFRLGDGRDQRRLRFVKRVLPRLLERGIGVWITFYHRDRSNIDVTGSVGYVRASRGGFPPRDRETFQALIRDSVRPFWQTVMASGKTPANWLVFQFGNEVLPRDVLPPDRPVRFWHGTSDQYLSMLDRGYAAVKQIDATIPVAMGGISSSAMEAIMAGHGAVGAWNDRLLRRGRFDYAAVHLRHRTADVPAKIRWVRARWPGPLAATEIAGPDPRVARYSESRQADDLRVRLGLARKHGVDRLFWASMADSPFVAEHHRREGLIEPKAWRRKPAFEAYRRLIANRADPGGRR